MTEKIDKFLIVSIDCWRRDALSRTNPRMNTPKFDLLTRDYAFAERYFVTAPATRPSHTSLFTGLYPFEHGLLGQTYLKMFAGVVNLFDVFAAAGYSVRGFSERPDVFRFLDFAPFIGPVDPAASQQHLGSLERLCTELIEPSGPQFKFLHFWYTHGGYGLGDIPHPPNLGQLVAAGQVEEALRYYEAAVTHVLEFSLVELLKRIDLDEWAVFICGDHGEGFCREVMAHGDRLHPNVVHVPMLAHVPGGFSFPRDGAVSAIDLFPTIAALADLPTDYRGFGQNWLEPSAASIDRWVLSELDSLYGIGFLSADNLRLPEERVTSPTAIDGEEIARYTEGIREWCLCDGRHFYRENEQTGAYVLRDLRHGNDDLACEDPSYYRAQYRALRDRSAYQQMQAQSEAAGEAAILKERLRALGYLD